jgi:endonuclease V-like protein UPF0215 family
MSSRNAMDLVGEIGNRCATANFFLIVRSEKVIVGCEQKPERVLQARASWTVNLDTNDLRDAVSRVVNHLRQKPERRMQNGSFS